MASFVLIFARGAASEVRVRAEVVGNEDFLGKRYVLKLHEELLIADASSGTEHRKIMRAEERFVAWSELRGALNTLEQACDSFDYEAIKRFIERLVEGADLAEQLMDLSGQVVAAPVIALPRGRGNEHR